MGEVEQVCDRVGVISKGELIAEGRVAEIRGKSGILVRAEPLKKAAEIAGGIEGIEEAEIRDDALHLTADPDLAPQVNQKLSSNGVRVREVREENRSLEDVFLELTGREGGE